MAEHDFIIDNGTGSAVRTDLNNVLQAIASNNSKSGALTTNYAYQWHVDTSDGNLKIRNAANNGYVTVGPVATTNFGLAPLAGAKAVTFTNPFFVGTSSLLGANTNLPSVGINAQNMVSGDYFEVSSVSGTGFTVHFKNSSNASIDRNFTYQAVGFGKGG